MMTYSKLTNLKTRRGQPARKAPPQTTMTVFAKTTRRALGVPLERLTAAGASAISTPTPAGEKSTPLAALTAGAMSNSADAFGALSNNTRVQAPEQGTPPWEEQNQGTEAGASQASQGPRGVSGGEDPPSQRARVGQDPGWEAAGGDRR